MICTTVIICSVAALVAGFIDAIAGGGGLITMPALLLSGVPPHAALACNKVSACAGTAVALGNFARSGLVLWKPACLAVAFALAGSYVGSSLTLYIRSEVLAKILVGLLPLAMAATLLPRKERVSHKQDSALFWFLLPLVCLLIGAYDGFFGPGTGSFLILAFHYILGVNLIAASATAKVLNLASSLAAMLTFIYYGAVVWPLALAMMAGSVTGNWLGSCMAIKVGPQAVRRFLTVSLSLLLLTLIWEYFLV